MVTVHIGEPKSDGYPCYESNEIHVHNFLDLPDAKSGDNVVESPEFKCFGHTWRLEVYPAGDHDDVEDGDDFISVYIRNLSDEKITVDYRFIVMETNGKESSWIDDWENVEFDIGCAWGTDLIRRVVLIDNQSHYLVNGALVIKVQMRPSEEYYVKSLELTVDNVIDEFMKADGNNHNMAKAAAKKFIIEHKEEVVASESLNRLYESKELMIEVMQALASVNLGQWT
eukprot:scaffold49424_cov30-Cyclotella_meneghiniana.AAC.5